MVDLEVSTSKSTIVYREKPLSLYPAVYKDTSKSTIVYIEKPPSLYPAVYKDTSKFTIVYREKPLLTVPVIIYRPRIAVSLSLPLSL
jgi:hypothetical protein